IYTVVSGDLLVEVARRYYGHEKHWVHIARANPTVDPHRLRVGQELRLPHPAHVLGRASGSGEAEPVPPPPPGNVTHTVRSGETLSSIAQQHYGGTARWRAIFNANRDTIGDDPNRLDAGTTLRIPPAE
ncbi:MAG: LysM peptidoglycan-binding domain-containing protein, partial [Phycisphaeraceae bacterium]